MITHHETNTLCYYICFKQVDETVDWLSDYFLRSRLSKPDLRSFGLYAAWTPYMSEVFSFLEHLVGCLINMPISSCARESVGSSKVMKGKHQISEYIEHIKTLLFSF